MSAVESNCTTLMFTSDMLKKLRKQQQLEQLEQQLIPRPPGQPQQRQLPPNPGPVDSSFPHNKPSTTDHEQMTAPISADDSCIASVDTSQAAVIKPAKSTPSILAQLSSTPVQTSATSGPSWQLPMQQPQQLPGNWQLPPTAASGTSATSTIADGGSCKTNSFESLPAVMTDVDQDCYSETQDSFEHDSLDVVQQLNSSAAKNSSSKNSTPSSSFSSPGSKASSLSSSSSSRILKHISSGNQAGRLESGSSSGGHNGRNHHAHSNSDSGLSSLSGGSGGVLTRISTLSPVSTVSTLSSVSSASSASVKSGSGSNGLLTSTPTKTQSGINLRTGKGSANGSGSCDSGTGTLNKKRKSPASASDTPAPISTFSSSGTAITSLTASTSASGSTSAVANQAQPNAAMSKRRSKTQEEIECEELSKELVRDLPPGSHPKLQDLFVVLPSHKTPADYIEGILELVDDVETTSGSVRQGASSSSALSSDEDCGGSEATFESGSEPQHQTRRDLSPSLLRQKIEELEFTEQRLLASSSTPVPKSVKPPSAYKPASTSQDHPEVIDQGSVDSNRQQVESHSSKMRLLEVPQEVTRVASPSPDGSKVPTDLQSKKEELLRRISHKLDVLRAAELSLKEEMALNDQLGRDVTSIVKASEGVKPSQVLKFKLHLEEIDRITSLLLGLSARLARTENALNSIPSNSSNKEKALLEDKKCKLEEQLSEAKRLKESIDRRSSGIADFLQTHLNTETYEDYQHFVKMKAKLIMDSREISDKIKLGEEQIRALRESMLNPQSPNLISSLNPSPALHRKAAPAPSPNPSSSLQRKTATPVVAS